jgi:hypothetical protein
MSDLYGWVPWRETVCPGCEGSGRGASGLCCMVCGNLPPKDIATADMWLRQTTRTKIESHIAELEEQITWTIKRCNAAMNYGQADDVERFSGTINSSVAAVCDALIAARGIPTAEEMEQEMNKFGPEYDGEWPNEYRKPDAP